MSRVHRLTGPTFFALPAVVACLVASPAPADAETRRLAATARAKDGTTLFVQRAAETWEGPRLLRVQTRFVDPAGKEIARREVEAGASALLPREVFEDPRTGYRTESRPLADGRVEVRLRTSRDDDEQRAVLKPKLPPVNGAGVLEAIRSHWGRLQAGGKVDFALVTPQRLDWYHFRLRKLRQGTHNGRAVTTIVMEADSVLIRPLAGECRFTIDDASGGLVRYTGPMDVQDGDGDRLWVDVSWRDPLPGARPVPPPPLPVAGPSDAAPPAGPPPAQQH